MYIYVFNHFCTLTYILPDDRWRCSWLRRCATSRKVAGSIPVVVIGIFHLHKLSDHTMA
jgi:hypothetical protein